MGGEGTGRRRYVIAYNPEQAEVDRINREKTLAKKNLGKKRYHIWENYKNYLAKS